MADVSIAPDEGVPERESKAERRLRKETEKLADSRPLEGWERYRALGDLIDHLTDIIELADRRTRFALLILAALNALNLVVGVRADQLRLEGLSPSLLRGYIAAYVLLSLYFFAYAILALRPRLRQRDRSEKPGRGRLRLVDDILDRSPDEYFAEWQQVQIGQLNREMSNQAHILARTNAAKYAALGRVYLGLIVLVALTAMMVLTVGLHFVVMTAVP